MSTRFWWYNVFQCAPSGDLCQPLYTNCSTENYGCFSLAQQCETDDDSCYALVGRCTDIHQQCYSLWEQVHLAALIPATISILCSIYIIFCTLKYRNQFKSMTFGSMLPMFISICDIGFHTFHGLDHIHNISTGYVTEGGWCLIFGATAILFINCQTMWECTTGFCLNYCVRKQQPPTFGKNKWKLHLICWGLPSIIYVSGYILEVYGVEGAWCGVTDIIAHFFILDLWLIVGMVFLFIIYIWTGILLYSTMYGDFENKQVDTDRIKRTFQSLPWFPLVYMFQWMPYVLWKLIGWEQNWGETMYDVVITNLGGMLNAIIFHKLLVSKRRKEWRRYEDMDETVVNSQNVTKVINK